MIDVIGIWCDKKKDRDKWRVSKILGCPNITTGLNKLLHKHLENKKVIEEKMNWASSIS